MVRGTDMEYRTLGKTGLKVSALGFGASPLGGVFGDIDEAEGIRAVHAAVDLGINFFDVSPYYGLTRAETVLGKALKEIPRDRYYVATKVGRYGADQFDFSARRVAASVDESLARLNVDYSDEIKTACAEAVAFCRKRGADISQVAIQFSLANRDLATTLVGMARHQNLLKNVRWAQETTRQDLRAEVLTILTPIHNRTWPSGLPENN